MKQEIASPGSKPDMSATVTIQITQQQNWTDIVNQIMEPKLPERKKETKWVLWDEIQISVLKDLSQGTAPPHFQNKMKLRKITIPTETGKANKEENGELTSQIGVL